ncbi:hypothetical protein BC829DRAFT_447336 [Chytridium lagenaria]|nr:hypothetical protein BC829DRAFT_447336 [Chytridium lagenaria]
MAVLFHHYNRAFFPGTDSLDEIGHRVGKNYAINILLQLHINDASYAYNFESVMTKTDMQACVVFMKKFNVPMLVLKGGGYTIRSVARVDFAPDHSLHPEFMSQMAVNGNSRQYLDFICQRILEQFYYIELAPSVQM